MHRLLAAKGLVGYGVSGVTLGAATVTAYATSEWMPVFAGSATGSLIFWWTLMGTNDAKKAEIERRRLETEESRVQRRFDEYEKKIELNARRIGELEDQKHKLYEIHESQLSSIRRETDHEKIELRARLLALEVQAGVDTPKKPIPPETP